MKPRFEPVTPRPVRTVSAIEKRRKAEKTAALHARLAREVQEKAREQTNATVN